MRSKRDIKVKNTVIKDKVQIRKNTKFKIKRRNSKRDTEDSKWIAAWSDLIE